MNKTDSRAFTFLWTAMAEQYGKTVSDAAQAMAFAALERCHLDDIRRAISAHVADPERGRWMAKPADLIMHIDGDPESRSLQAWSKVLGAIQTVGPYQTVVFDEPSIMAALEDMGGWIELCNISEDEAPFKRNEFVKRYKGYLNRPALTHLPKLVGISESHNMQHAPKFKTTPVLIGNPQRAMLVLESGSNSGPKAISLTAHLEKMSLNKLTDQSGSD
jgi:hypothetical protein